MDDPHVGGEAGGADAARADREPATERPCLTPDELGESRRYSRQELVCTLLDMAIDVIYLGVMAFWGARSIDRALSLAPVLGEWAVLRLACLFLIITALHYACSFPLAVYSGFVLEHRFGLSRQSFGRWLSRYALRNLLATGLGLVLMVGLFLLIWWAQAWWWLIAALAAFAVTIVLGQLVPVLILPLFYEIEKLEDQDLRERLERLARGTSLSIEGVYRMKLSTETVKANAMLAGLGRTRRVILGDTLLDNFDAREIEVVFAHEVAHHVYRHLAKLTLFGLVYAAVSFWVCDRILVAWVTAVAGSFQYPDCPVHALALILFVITVLSLLVSPVRNGLSRRFESACDRYALQVTGDVEAYRAAFTRLARLNKTDPHPHPLDVWLLHDHPPVAARLALADQFTAAPRSCHWCAGSDDGSPAR
ncbi:MAG: M48 family metallopeptidase [Planctomycetaceae bacterium]|nr:M48 family metallopeptidase [Planctomycetaceae bacterium]